MGKYFGTDGFRGEANENLTADHAYKVGRFLGWYYGELKRQNGDDTPARIIIGKDTRRSSYMFEYTLVGGLVASGADAYLLHVTTTPSVAYVARVDEFDCGIMISASHNPYFDNGIKLINGNGEKMDEETISLVEAYLDGNLEVFGQKWEEIPFAKKEKIGCTVDYVSGRNRYIGYLISLGVYSFRGVKVALDCANGSSWNIAKAVFDALGAKTYVINAQPDGTNINNNAGSTRIGGLQKYVVENGMDVGFAYDGDADRCLCVDEKGNVITGDHILYIYGKYMKERGKLLTNTVVTTVMSNFGLYKAFDELGIDYAKTAVGDKYVYEYMMKNGCRIGGEQSGHIIFSKYASTGDGILTSLKIMEVMMARKKKLSELAEGFTVYPQVLTNVRVTDKKAAQDDADVQAAVKKVTEELGDTGRILVRESGTEPVVRVMVEAESEEICQKSGRILKELCTRNHIAVWNIGTVYNVLIFCHTGKIVVQSHSSVIVVVHLKTCFHNGFTKVNVYQNSRKSCFCKHFPQVGGNGTLTFIRLAAGQKDLAGIFTAEFNINTKSVHRFGNCIGQLRKVYIKLVHYFVRPLFLPRLRCCSSSRSIT